MNCVIKNIPLHTFGIAGNRGVGFPLTDYCSLIPSITDICYIVLQEDRRIALGQEEDREQLIYCSYTGEICFMALEQDSTIPVAQQEDRSEIYVECVEHCHLVPKFNLRDWLTDHQGNYIFLDCPPDPCFVRIQGQDGVFLSDRKGNLVATTCPPEPPSACYVGEQQDSTTWVVDHAGNYVVTDCLPEPPSDCYVGSHQDASSWLIDYNGNYVKVECSVLMCSLKEQGYLGESIVDQINRESILAVCSQCYLGEQDYPDNWIIDQNNLEHIYTIC